VQVLKWLAQWCTGVNLQIFLICFYALTAVAFAAEKDWARMSYFICAGGITLSVIFM